MDAEGNVRYDAIALQGHRDGRKIQSQFKDLVPLNNRRDLTDEDRSMDRPSEEEVNATAERTKAALEKLVNGKIKAAQPKHVPDTQGKSSFVRYTPGQQSGSGGLKQRIIKMTEVVEDPLEPPRFKHKKIPRGPPSPPPPILRSPPRKATAAEQKEWMIPPCISNWKNNKGFTIPLDKRLAADGRGLQDVHINDNFAKLSESLFVADRLAREEVRQRALMQQKIAEKEKASKEENLRLLAQRAREERSGAASSAPAIARPAALKSALAGYGSDSGSGSGGEDEEDEEGEEEGDEDRKLRDEMRREKRQQRERELRMNNMGTEQRAKVFARWVIYPSRLIYAHVAAFSGSKIATFRKRLPWVWQSQQCPKNPCLTRVFSTASLCRAPSPMTTRTIYMINLSSMVHQPPPPFTSRAAECQKETTSPLAAGLRRASERHLPMTGSVLGQVSWVVVWALREMPRRRHGRDLSSSKKMSALIRLRLIFSAWISSLMKPRGE